MLKNIFTLLNLFIFSLFFSIQAQESCEGEAGDPLLDLNSITKCSIEVDDTEHSKKSTKKQVKIQVSSRRRVVRKRDVASGLSTNNASRGLSSIKQNSSFVGSLDLNKEVLLEKVPFNLVEEVPLFKSCEKVPIIEQQKCFNQEIANHIKKNLNYPSFAYQNNIQGRVLAQFVINKNGEVTDLNLRGPYRGELLEEEAKRIINKLPKFKPGKHNGKTVKVKYGVPISFKIPGKAPSNIRKTNVVLKEIHNFNAIDQLPAFKNCQNSNNEDCFNSELVKHVNNYFSYPTTAIDNNIEGKVLVYFVIDKDGDVVNITTRGPKGTKILEDATKKLFEKLPHFTPGKHKGKAVNVKHVFPLDFKLH